MRISDEPERILEAQQLRVRSVDDAEVQVALSRQMAFGEPSLVKIRSIIAEADRVGHPPGIPDSLAFRLSGELTLMEGRHRTCALFLLDPPELELNTDVVSGEAAWSAYLDPWLRVDS